MANGQKEWMVQWYETAAGEIPARTFLEGLTGRNRDEALALLELVKRRGNQIGLPKSKALGGGLFELRGHQVRLAYMFRPGRVILILDGVIKKQDELPPVFVRRIGQMQAAILARDRQTERGS